MNIQNLFIILTIVSASVAVIPNILPYLPDTFPFIQMRDIIYHLPFVIVYTPTPNETKTQPTIELTGFRVISVGYIGIGTEFNGTITLLNVDGRDPYAYILSQADYNGFNHLTLKPHTWELNPDNFSFNDVNDRTCSINLTAKESTTYYIVVSNHITPFITVKMTIKDNHGNLILSIIGFACTIICAIISKYSGND